MIAEPIEPPVRTTWATPRAAWASTSRVTSRAASASAALVRGWTTTSAPRRSRRLTAASALRGRGASWRSLSRRACGAVGLLDRRGSPASGGRGASTMAARLAALRGASRRAAGPGQPTGPHRSRDGLDWRSAPVRPSAASPGPAPPRRPRRGRGGAARRPGTRRCLRCGRRSPLRLAGLRERRDVAVRAGPGRWAALALEADADDAGPARVRAARDRALERPASQAASRSARRRVRRAARPCRGRPARRAAGRAPRPAARATA